LRAEASDFANQQAVALDKKLLTDLQGNDQEFAFWENE
jgi:hypothetical protein